MKYRYTRWSSEFSAKDRAPQDTNLTSFEDSDVSHFLLNQQSCSWRYELHTSFEDSDVTHFLLNQRSCSSRYQPNKSFEDSDASHFLLDQHAVLCVYIRQQQYTVFKQVESELQYTCLKALIFLHITPFVKLLIVLN